MVLLTKSFQFKLNKLFPNERCVYEVYINKYDGRRVVLLPLLFYFFKEIQPWKWAILNEPYVICHFVSCQNSRWRWQINFMVIKIKRCYSPCAFPLANGQPMIGTPWLILSITKFHPVMGKKCSNRFVWQNFQLGRPVIH